MRTPRGTVYHDERKGIVRFRVVAQRKNGKTEKLDSSIKVIGKSKRAIEDIKQKAQRRIDTFVASIISDEPVAPGPSLMMPYREWVDYCDEHIFKGRKTTLKSRKHRMRRSLEAFGDKPVGQITALDIQTVINHMEKVEQVAYETVNHTKVSNHWYLQKAVDFLKLPYNPAKAVMLDESRKAPPIEDWLTPGDIRELLKTNRLIVEMKLKLGLRRAEVLGARWSRIDLTNGWFQVDHTIIVMDGRSEPQDAGKSDAAARKIPIPPRLLAKLRELREQEPEAVYVFHPEGDNGFMSISTFDKMMERILSRAGFRSKGRNITPHKLRHSFSVYLGLSGLDDYHQDLLMGHSPKGLRGKVYRKPVYSLLPPAMERIEKMMHGEIPMVMESDDEPVIVT